ncbi:kinase domain containing protein [Coccidioides posadasii C735 delta SOWgp]|uniref:Kinase domain containing protein n=1 Tax=Coccidioides posadasii (strain C735) TaxID=222929 RepID=C5P237_COCP7|nr:kinase domain containing protein [Coccidioides posadasii C735 delta SOWgp]EER28940.1 kinase domain containing protein [Coccidioides posadasii C735 delta SOWgp]|eukprot:XP_003071085.1 kinase domain containing protein [Coccidioides posadasii C735 delta SOWgp]
MAFMLLSQTLRRCLSVCFSLKNWIEIALISPLSRLIHWPTCHDIEAGPQYDYEANEIGRGKVETISRDAQGQFISGGLTGIVELLDDGTVLKSPFPDAEMENHILDIAKEASIYHRVGPHERLVRILGHSRDGLILEYMKNGDLKTYIQARSSIPMSLKLKWAYQIAQAVSLLHSNGIIHCDIKPRNFLLDATLNIKIIDFSGSSLDGSKPASGEGTRFYLPRHWRDPPTVATDLFALGSTLYEVFQETSPYEEIPSDQVEVLFKRKEFPNVSAIPCGKIIKQCWLSQVASAEHVQAFIRDIIRSKLNADCIPHLDGLDIAKGMLIDQVGYP